MWGAHVLLLWGTPGTAQPQTPAVPVAGGGPPERKRRPQIVYVLDVAPDGTVRQQRRPRKQQPDDARVVVEVDSDVTLPAVAPQPVRAAARAVAEGRPGQFFRITLPRVVVAPQADDEEEVHAV